MKALSAITHAIQHGAHRVKQIAQVTGYAVPTTHARLHEMKRAGHVVSFRFQRKTSCMHIRSEREKRYYLKGQLNSRFTHKRNRESA